MNISPATLTGFWRKYDFPAHLLVLFDVLLARISTFFWTVKLKGLLRAMRCPYGRGLRVDGNPLVRIARRGGLVLGRQVTLSSRFGANLAGGNSRTVLHCIGGGSIRIGDNSGCSSAVLSAMSRIEIGQHVLVGVNARLYDHDFHSLDPQGRRDRRRDQQQVRSRPIIIGDDVLIGANSVILKGVTIGDRSVIGAGAVVTLRDIPPDSLVAGNPARIIRRLAGPGSAAAAG
ncbi:acyltransferase [bacterium]|nr:acyltransferase [bacterium]